MTVYLLLLKYELKKMILNRVTVLAVLFMSVFLLISSAQRFFQPDNPRHASRTEAFLEGRVMDDDFFHDVAANRDVEQHPEWRFARRYVMRTYRAVGTRGSVLWDSEEWLEKASAMAEKFYAHRQETMDEIAETFFLTEGERAYWRTQEERIEKPFTYYSTNDAQELRESYQMIATFSFLLTGLCVSGVFAGERARRTDALIYSSRFGRWKIFGVKMLAGVLFSLGTGCILLLFTHLPVFLFSGLHGLHAPWQMAVPFSPVAKTVGEMLGLHTVVFFAGCLVTGCLTALFSVWFGQTIAAAGVMFAIIIADLFFAVPTSLRLLSQLRYLTPVSVLINSQIQDMRLTKLFGRYLISFQTAPILSVVVGIVACFVAAFFFRKESEGK